MSNKARILRVLRVMRHKWKCKVPRCRYFFVVRVFRTPGQRWFLYKRCKCANVVGAGVCAVGVDPGKTE